MGKRRCYVEHCGGAAAGRFRLHVVPDRDTPELRETADRCNRLGVELCPACAAWLEARPLAA